MSEEKNAEEYYKQGNAYYKQGEYDKAIEEYTKAIELKPYDAYAYYNRGITYKKKDYYDKAIEDFNKAIELNPNDADAYNSRGNAYADKGEYDKAIENYNKAIDLKSDYTYVYYNLGLVYNDKGEYDKAIEYFNEAIDLKPDYADAYKDRGNAYADKGEYDKAIEDYNKAIEIEPNYAMAYYNSGLAYNKKGYYDKAIENYNKAIELKPDYVDAYYSRGYLHYYLFNNNIIHEEIQSDITLTYTDWNTFIYLSRNTGKLIEYIHTLTEFYKPYPQTIQTILEYANVNIDSMLFNRFEDAQQAIADFTELLQLYENVIPDRTKFLSIKAILHYYLGGAVSSYIIFDEQLDDDEYTLSSQEYYYYALTAKTINWEAEAILNNAICDIQNKTDKTAEDFYYLAHLYLLRNDEAKAIEYFKQSDSFIFSVIMLAYLSGDNNYIKRVEQINQEEEIYNFSREIDYTRKDLSQFQNFFHISECKTYINSSDENVSRASIFEEYNEPFWEVFKLSFLDKKNITDLNKAITRIEIEKEIGIVSDEYYQYYWTVIEYAIEENKNIYEALKEDAAKKKLEELLEKFKKQLESEVKETNINEFQRKFMENSLDSFKSMEYIIVAKANNLNIENHIGTQIEELEHRNHLFYHYLIQLEYLKNDIDSKSVFYLYFYWLHIIKKKRAIDFDSLVLELGKIVANGTGLKILFTMAKPAWKIVKQILKEYEEYETYNPTAPSDYVQFRENFWKYIANDKETLSESEFERKYRCFEWFDMKS